MIWLYAALLALVALLPLLFMLLRPARARGRQEADRALYRAQLEELDRDRAAGRLDAAAHAAATTEVQRRLLAAPEEQLAAGSGRGLLLASAVVLPALAFGVYYFRGTPDMPSAPFAERRATQDREETLLASLRERIASLPPRSEQARQGWYLLGNAERARGRGQEAAAAWEQALSIRFDADLAGALAELQIQLGETAAAAPWLRRALEAQPEDPRLRFLTGLAEARAGRLEAAREIWRAMLATAPAEAPWRGLVERALTELN